MTSTVAWPSLWMSWYILMLPAVYSKEVLVSKHDVMRDWYKDAFKVGSYPGNSATDWGNSQTGPKQKTYVDTCGFGENAELWFITKHVLLDSIISDIIYVDVEAELTLCYHPGEDRNVSCSSNYFEIFIYRGENGVYDIKKPSTVNEILTIFFPLHNITNNTSPDATLTKTTQTFSFNAQNNSEGVTFAIRSRGACGTIYRMKMYYYYCEETFINGVKFENTSSPARGFNKSVNGSCSENAKPSNNATVFTGFCHDNGTWSLPVGDNLDCLCTKGYTLRSRTGSCLPCSAKSYKKELSNDKCTECPNNAVSNSSRTGCVCEEDYYRLLSRNPESCPCYALPEFNKNPTILLNANSVNISWTKPNNSVNETTFYNVTCYNCSASYSNEIEYNPRQNNLTTTWVEVSNLEYGRSYVFRVYARNILYYGVPEGEWKYLETDPVKVTYKATIKPDPSEGDDSSLYIITGAVCVLVIILIIFILIFLVRRKSGRNRLINAYGNRGVELPDVGRRLYVDPSNYDDPEAALLEFTNELDSKLVFLERLIGGGEFGDVYKGVLTKKGEKKIKIPIAAKTLKHDADEKSERDFTLEASVMGQFDNPNIVRLEGVITKSTPRMIILEYMSNGSLDNYLKSNDSMLTNLQLIGMARGVSAGMQYLEEINFVHRDLAARNILVNDDLLCKIADFGLSRELETKETSRSEYSAHGGKIPVRWTAPEAIKLRKFSSASDVWSYGIVLWEIMSYAERPYWEWDNFKVLEELDSGYRLPPPLNCPKGVHELMLHCWKAERSERPCFSQITIVIDKWIRSPETLDDELTSLTPIGLVTPRCKSPQENVKQVYFDGFILLLAGEWLASLKMNSYETNFVKAGYKRKSEIIDLTDEDLKNIGVTLAGHRNKMKKGIDSLRSIQQRESVRV